eukprot:3760360-Rhodomonas_salina.1
MEAGRRERKRPHVRQKEEEKQYKQSERGKRLTTTLRFVGIPHLFQRHVERRDLPREHTRCSVSVQPSVLQQKKRPPTTSSDGVMCSVG